MKNFVKRLYLFPLIALIGFQSCKGLKKGGGQDVQKAWKTVLSNAEKESLDFKTLSLSGKAQLNIESMNLNNMGVSYRVSIEKDKRIWIRVSKIIEAARILATPDSLYVLDKINRRYIACDYSLAEEMTGLKMDFGVMQDLILGNFNPIPEDLSPGLITEKVQDFGGSAAGTNFTYKIDQQSFKVQKIQATNEALKQHTEITYGEFVEKGNTLMPQNTHIEMLSPEEVSIDLNHRKVEINPSDASFNFKVPSGYARSGCK